MGSTTLDYYDQNAEGFAAGTLDVKFTAIQDRFLGYLAPGALILDFGCGSGRDSRYFLSRGYKVEACDGSEQMVKIAEKTAGIPVKQMLFDELSEVERYDGIFACASLNTACAIGGSAGHFQTAEKGSQKRWDHLRIVQVRRFRGRAERKIFH